MSLLAFTGELYFAAVLGVAGLAKIGNPRRFATALLQQKIFPAWCINIFVKIVPWIEIVIALMVIFNAVEPLTAILILALFIVFLGLKIFLLATGRVEDCGCYGSAKPEEVDGASIVVSALLVLFAAGHLWLITRGASVGWLWRLPVGILFTGTICFLAARTIIRRRSSPPASQAQAPDAGGLLVGEQAPMFVALDQSGNEINLAHFQGQRRLLAFVLPGCPICPGALRVLHKVLQENPNLVGFVIGSPDESENYAYAIEQNIRIPLLTPDSELTEKMYHVLGFPLIFVLDERGVIRAKGVVNRDERMQELLGLAFTPLAGSHQALAM